MEVKFRDEFGHERSFSPARDIAIFWPALMAAAVEGLEKANWDEPMKRLLEPAGIRERDLMLALINATRFCERTSDPAFQTPREVLQAVNFFQSPPEAIMALLYRLGIVSLGAWFDGIKRSTPAHSVSTEVAKLAQSGKLLMQQLNEYYQEEAKRGESPP
jgi:hypothetical protein